MQVEESRSVRLYWDYSLIFEWSDDIVDSQLCDVEDELPESLVDRVRRWGERMDEAFGSIYLEDSTPVRKPVKNALESEYLAILKQIEGLGYTMVREGRWPFDLP